MRFFPFDSQSCLFKFASWSYWKDVLNLKHMYPTNDLEGEVKQKL